MTPKSEAHAMLVLRRAALRHARALNANTDTEATQHALDDACMYLEDEYIPTTNDLCLECGLVIGSHVVAVGQSLMCPPKRVRTAK
jgi:hypothetical protein